MKAPLARPLMCKANTSGVMTFISFLFYSPLLLIITHSSMQMRSSDLIMDPFRTYAIMDPREIAGIPFFYDALQNRCEQRSLPLF